MDIEIRSNGGPKPISVVKIHIMNFEMKTKSLIFSVLLLCATSITAQYEDYGRLNKWTVEDIQRRDGYKLTKEILCSIKVETGKKFDRIVFEFKDAKPYFALGYLDSNIYSHDGGDFPIEIAGNSFFVITFYMGSWDNPPCTLKTYPKGELRMPVVWQITRGIWWEGQRDFIIGLKAKTPFRVKALKKPRRLVVDFRKIRKKKGKEISGT